MMSGLMCREHQANWARGFSVDVNGDVVIIALMSSTVLLSHRWDCLDMISSHVKDSPVTVKKDSPATATEAQVDSTTEQSGSVPSR